MRKIIFATLWTSISFIARSQGPGLSLDDNEFMIEKKVIAKVKDVKLGGFQGREMRLLGPNDEILLAMPGKTLTIGTPPRYINYAHIFVPALNDSIQIYMDSLKADGVKLGLTSPDDEAWADYFFRKKIVNDDGSLNIENVKAFDKKGNPLKIAKMDENSYTIYDATKLAKVTYNVSDTYDTEGGAGFGGRFGGHRHWHSPIAAGRFGV